MAMVPRVLVVDDDPVIRELLQAYLGEEGYDVLCAGNAEQAEACLAECAHLGQPVELVLLDIRLPGKDGLTLTRELRVRSEVGIILITGRNDEIDRIVGLECGADDYVIKPLNPRELVSRAKNLIRRVRHAQASAGPARQALRQFGDWLLDADRRRLIDHAGNETLLTHGEFQLLGAFLRNSGHTLSRDQLMDQIRNREWLPSDRSIDVLVGRLRRKLRDDPAEPQLIITIHGTGYLFTADLILAYRTPARDRDLAFSAEPVLREDVAIFYNRQRPVRIQSLGDLAGYRGGLLFGESYGADFDRFVGRHGNVEWVSDSRQNFGKLVRQRIDYIAHERRTGTLFAERLAGGENIRALPEPLTVDYLRVAVSRHSPLAAKMDEIDRALRGYRDDGSIQRWLDDSVRDYRRLAGNRADAW